MKVLKQYWPLAFVIFFGLIPLLWFKPGFLMARGDLFPSWFNTSEKTFSHDLFLWDSSYGGVLSLWPSFIIVETIWYFLLHFFHLSASTTQIVFEIFLFMGRGLAMFYLASVVYKKSKIIPTIAALFYMINFYILLESLNYAVLWLLLFLPLVLVFLIKIVENIKAKEKTFTNIFYFSLFLTILMSFVIINPPLLISSLLAITIVLFYFLIFERKIRTRIIKNFLKVALLSFLMSLWWLIPTVTYFFSRAGSSLSLGTVIDVVEWIEKHINSGFLNLFWLNGIWSWGPEYYPYFGKYYNPIVKLAVFIPMILAFSTLFFKKNRNQKINSYLALTILFLLFLAKGLHLPFDNINLALYQYIPGFFLFREPIGKIFPVLIIFLALLIGSFSQLIFDYIKEGNLKRKKLLILGILISIVGSFLVSSFPVLTGEIIRKENIYLPFSSYIKIPNYWFRLADYVNSLSDNFKILTTPNNDNYAIPYRWGYYGVDSLPERLIDKPILQQQFGYLINPRYKVLVGKMYDSISNNQSAVFSRLLRLFNIGEILQRNDVWWDFKGRDIISATEVKQFLSQQEGITQDKSFGDVDLFRVSNIDNFSLFSVPERQVFLTGGVNCLAEVMDFPALEAKTAIYLSDGSPQLEKVNGILGIGKSTVNDCDKEPKEEFEFFYKIPYAKHSPTSLIYPLVLLKEKKLEERFDNWQGSDVKKFKELIGLKIFHASKRISEIEKFKNWDFDKGLEAYRQKIFEITSILERIKASSDKNVNQEFIDTLRGMSHVLNFQEARLEKVLDERTFAWDVREEKMSDILPIFEQLNIKIEDLIHQLETNEIVYKINVPLSGDYQLFIKNEDFNRYLKDTELKLETLGKQVIIPLSSNQDGWIPSESFKFEKGEQELILTKPETINLVRESSWKNNLAESSFVENKLIIRPHLELAFANASTTYFKPIENYQGDTSYKITFDYYLSGGKGRVALIQDIDIGANELTFILYENLSRTSENSPRHFEKIIKSGRNAKSAEFYFWGNVGKNKDFKINFINVKIEKLFQPTVVLYLVQNQKTPQLPKIESIKVNPTKYKVKVEGAKEPYQLVFSESFHKGWKAYITNKDTFGTLIKRPIPENKHFLINGYANSWYISPDDSHGNENYEIIVEFLPQRFFYVGLWIFFATLLTCLGYLGYALKKEKFKNEKRN